MDRKASSEDRPPGVTQPSTAWVRRLAASPPARAAVGAKLDLLLR